MDIVYVDGAIIRPKPKLVLLTAKEQLEMLINDNFSKVRDLSYPSSSLCYADNHIDIKDTIPHSTGRNCSAPAYDSNSSSFPEPSEAAPPLSHSIQN